VLPEILHQLHLLGRSTIASPGLGIPTISAILMMRREPRYPMVQP
jgi:hypothetical protein